MIFVRGNNKLTPSIQLDEYQEQSYLLDPFLEKLVAPVVECLKVHANLYASGRGRPGSITRVGRVALLLYSYIKCRGYKTISQCSAPCSEVELL